MELVSAKLGDAEVITVKADRIDAAVAIRFKDAMREIVDEGRERVILDLSRVAFVDSSGLGAIVAVRKFLGQDRKLDLVGLTPDVDKVFRLTRMDTVFGIYRDIDAATSRAAG